MRVYMDTCARAPQVEIQRIVYENRTKRLGIDKSFLMRRPQSASAALAGAPGSPLNLADVALAGRAAQQRGTTRRVGLSKDKRSSPTRPATMQAHAAGRPRRAPGVATRTTSPAPGRTPPTRGITRGKVLPPLSEGVEGSSSLLREACLHRGSHSCPVIPMMERSMSTTSIVTVSEKWRA